MSRRRASRPGSTPSRAAGRSTTCGRSRTHCCRWTSSPKKTARASPSACPRMPPDGPQARVESRQQAQAFRDALEQLPALQREAFLLQAEGGLSVEEVASAIAGVGAETGEDAAAPCEGESCARCSPDGGRHEHAGRESGADVRRRRPLCRPTWPTTSSSLYRQAVDLDADAPRPAARVRSAAVLAAAQAVAGRGAPRRRARPRRGRPKCRPRRSRSGSAACGPRTGRTWRLRASAAACVLALTGVASWQFYSTASRACGQLLACRWPRRNRRSRSCPAIDRPMRRCRCRRRRRPWAPVPPLPADSAPVAAVAAGYRHAGGPAGGAAHRGRSRP